MNEPIYHITIREQWDDALVTGVYRDESLVEEGFIHCSLAHQIVPVANRYFQGVHNLVLLEINPDRIIAEIKLETSHNDEYPHVYGPIPCDAVVKVYKLDTDVAGVFRLPPEIDDAVAGIVIDRLDHLVLTVANIQNTCEFYHDILGMDIETFGEGRISLRFGIQKINLHLLGSEVNPHALAPKPGSADLCFITHTPLQKVIGNLKMKEIGIEIGPVKRIGAAGPLESVYFRDPDGNLIELSNIVE